MRLTWVQPEDLLPHELVQSAAEGREVTAVAERWRAAGGNIVPPRDGASEPPAGPALRRLARVLLDELDALPAADVGDAVPAAVPALALPPAAASLLDRVTGGWLGRAAGCLLGKPVEKIPRDGIREILTATGRWPLAGYFTAAGLPAEVARRWPWNRRSRSTSLAENIDGMPEDDDLNFSMLALRLLERHGHRFDTSDVAAAWLADLPAGRVFTAERAAYRNLLDGLAPPDTATVRNPFREWIGAAIRADVYGWACPGDPAAAARLARTDARLSHVRAGVHWAMAVAAMTATACVTDDLDTVLAQALAVLPATGPLPAALRRGVQLGRSDVDAEAALDALYADYGHLHWVHSVNNAALVAFALTRGRGDFAASVCLAVTGGWDTDSDGATVGAVCGTLRGAAGVPDSWVRPLRDRVASSLPGFDGASLTDLARRTVAVAQHSHTARAEATGAAEAAGATG